VVFPHSSCITTVLAPFGIGAPVNSRAAQPDANVFPVLPAGMRFALNENIRPMGNDIQSGDVILSKGKQLQPQDIALAASVGAINSHSSCITTVLAPFGIGAPVNSRAAQPDANVFPVLPAGITSATFY
jgi:hypothetical protein